MLRQSRFTREVRGIVCCMLLIHSLVDPLIHFLIHSLTDSLFTYTVIDSLTHTFNDSLIDLLPD